MSLLLNHLISASEEGRREMKSKLCRRTTVHDSSNVFGRKRDVARVSAVEYMRDLMRQFPKHLV